MKYLIPLVIASSTLAASAVEIRLKDCPPGVRSTISSKLNGGVIDEIDRVQKNGVTRYVVDIDGPAGRDITFRMTPAGRVLFTSEDVKLSECPLAVRKSIQNLLQIGWRIDDIDREVNAKGTRFRVDFDRSNAKDVEYLLSRDGKVLERKVEKFD